MSDKKKVEIMLKKKEKNEEEFRENKKCWLD